MQNPHFFQLKQTILQHHFGVVINTSAGCEVFFYREVKEHCFEFEPFLRFLVFNDILEDDMHGFRKILKHVIMKLEAKTVRSRNQF